MDSSSIAGRAEKLRREIGLIEQEERIYRSHMPHSFVEKAEHKGREVRVVAIHGELKTLVQKATEQLSHGSVWYS